MHPLKQKALRQIKVHLIKYPFALLATLTTQIFSFGLGLLLILIVPIFGFIFFGFWGILITIVSWFLCWKAFSEDISTPTEIANDNFIQVEETIVHYITSEGFNYDNKILFKWFRLINREIRSFPTLTEYLISLCKKLEEIYASNPSDEIFTNLRIIETPTKFSTLGKPDIVFWYYDIFSKSINRKPIPEIIHDIKALKSRLQAMENRAAKEKLKILENKQKEKAIKDQKILQENKEIFEIFKDTPADKNWRHTLSKIEKNYKKMKGEEFPWVIASINGEWVIRRDGQLLQFPNDFHIEKNKDYNSKE